MSNRISFANVFGVAIVSSAVTAALIFFASFNASTVDVDEDDFYAHQGNPTSENQSHVPYVHQRLAVPQIRRRSKKFLQECQKRRTLRFFSRDSVPPDIIDNILQSACTAPSGAHKQPWTFVAVGNQQLKAKIREMVEEEETVNYRSRMRKTWVEDLRPMMDQLHSGAYNHSDNQGEDKIEKPYLTEAPWIIAVFKQTHGGVDEHTGKRIDHYYVQESVGIACGILCAAIQNANLVTLTSTPMGAEKGIRQLLERPDSEKLFLLLPVGFPAKNATVPYRDPERKPASETIVWKK